MASCACCTRASRYVPDRTTNPLNTSPPSQAACATKVYGSLLTIHCSLLTAHCSLLTTHVQMALTR
eukprot:scaffold97271_cov36-Phaeocystis_antarctica.AAC.1